MIFPAIERRFVAAKPPLFRPCLNFILMHFGGKYLFERSQKSTLSLLVDKCLLPTLTAAWRLENRAKIDNNSPQTQKIATKLNKNRSQNRTQNHPLENGPKKSQTMESKPNPVFTRYSVKRLRETWNVKLKYDLSNGHFEVDDVWVM